MPAIIPTTYSKSRLPEKAIQPYKYFYAGYYNSRHLRYIASSNMPDAYNFPATEPTNSAAKNWLMTIGPALVPVIVPFSSLPYWIFGGVILLFNIFVILLPFKRPLHINIDTDTRQLRYVHENLAGRGKPLTLNLRNIRGYYERERLSRFTFGWHLVLYNHWGLYQKLSIKEGNGYTREQLDQIVKLVNRCKESTV